MYNSRRKSSGLWPDITYAFAWLSQYSKLKQGELSQDEYDNWRYNYPNIEPTTGFVSNAISDDLDAELQDALSEEMKKRGLP